jgi:hypothetical protein
MGVQDIELANKIACFSQMVALDTRSCYEYLSDCPNRQCLPKKNDIFLKPIQ